MLILASAPGTPGNAFNLQALNIINNPEATVSAFLLFHKRHRRDYGLFKINMTFYIQTLLATTRVISTYLLRTNPTVFIAALYASNTSLNSEIYFIDSNMYSFFNISQFGLYFIINGIYRTQTYPSSWPVII